MAGKIRGMVSFKASGAEIYVFINRIRESRIICVSQQCRDGFFYGKIYRNNIKKLSKLAQECRIDLEYTDKEGLSFRIQRYRLRYGIAIGFILVGMFVFYLSNIVVSIEVCGNTGVTTEQIMTALSDIGIYKGKFIADIDFRICEQKLRLSIPEIAWTGIRHTGCRIVVDVTEIDPPPEMVNDDIPCNIVADKDAQITYVEVHSGRLMKKEGSGVKKGEIIISGIVDDGGGHILKKHAMGKIIGRYEECISFSQPFSSDGQIYNDEEITKKYFDFFGFRIPLFFKNIDYEHYDYTETSNEFMLFGKTLPFGMIHSTYKPFEYKTLSYSTEEADILLQQKLSLYEKNFYDSKNISVVNREIKKENYSDRLEYHVTYTLEGNIGMDYEIFTN